MNELLRRLLPDLPIFGGLGEPELERVAGLLEHHSYDDGAVIAEQGAIGTRMFILAMGTCRVTHDGNEGHPPVVLAELGPGDCVGEMALIEIRPRSATVTAVGHVELFSLSNADVLHLYASNLSTYTLIVLNVARELSRRLRKANEVISACARALQSTIR